MFACIGCSKSSSLDGTYRVKGISQWMTPPKFRITGNRYTILGSLGRVDTYSLMEKGNISIGKPDKVSGTSLMDGQIKLVLEGRDASGNNATHSGYAYIFKDKTVVLSFPGFLVDWEKEQNYK